MFLNFCQMWLWNLLVRSEAHDVAHVNQHGVNIKLKFTQNTEYSIGFGGTVDSVFENGSLWISHKRKCMEIQWFLLKVLLNFIVTSWKCITRNPIWVHSGWNLTCFSAQFLRPEKGWYNIIKEWTIYFMFYFVRLIQCVFVLLQ